MSTELAEWSVDELLAHLDAGDPFVFVDVRSAEEFAEWSIPGARNISSDELAGRLDELPRDQLIVTICARGLRSRGATQLLLAEGFSATSVDGGMAAWANVTDTAVFETSEAIIVQVRRRGKGCLGYVVGSAGHCVIVDPSLTTNRFTSIAQERGWAIDAVLDTHLHADHLSGARLIANETGAVLMVSDDDAFAFDHAPLPDALSVGRATITVFASPGHTMGSAMFLVDGAALLSGDTVFTTSVGRPDLADRAEAFAGHLYHSIHRALDDLADEVMVLPAHFAPEDHVTPSVVVGASLGELRKNLVALSLDEAAFVAWASGQATPRPPNYVAIVEANQGGDFVVMGTLGDLEVGPNRCAVSSH